VRCGLRPSDEQTGTSRNGHLTEFLGKLFAVITLFQVCFTFNLNCILKCKVCNVIQKLITLHHVYIDVTLCNLDYRSVGYSLNRIRITVSSNFVNF